MRAPADKHISGGVNVALLHLLLRRAPALVMLCACTGAMLGQQPDLILFNGRAFTGVADTPWAEAVAIIGPRIVAVGTSKEIAALAGPKTRRVDLAGRLLVPGFNDAHIHFSPPDGEYITFGSNNEPTCEAALNAVKEAILKTPTGKPLMVRIGQTAFFDGRCTASALDQLAPDRAVLLRTFDAQAAILNRSAAKMFGGQGDRPPVLGGFFGKDMNSPRWDGVVHEYENFRILDQQSTYREQPLRDFLQRAAEFGITSIQLMAWNPARMVALLSAVRPPLRVRLMSYLPTEGARRPKLRFPKVPAHIADRVTVSGIKWTLDGSPIERQSALRKPYFDDPSTSGKLNFSQSELQSMFNEARDKDVPLILHAIGDRTIDAVIQALEATGGKRVWANRRVRLEHANALAVDQLLKLKALGAVVVLNPPHFMGPVPQLVQSVLRSGIPLVLASDNAMNPHQNVMFASTYPSNRKEALTREQAVTAYTREAAFAEFREKDKGTLESGKFADLAVLSQDIFEVPVEALPKTRAVLTIVGGVIIHASQPFTVH
jgi:predicted amidohydrolase YtcJ